MTDHTQIQGDEDSRRAADLSRGRRRPPTSVPGCEAERFLGAGAYGEVWVAVDRNTGRRVAIKFFHHRGGLDWSQLSREVEKLVFLSADRYVVQLLEVGWQAEPPYYVMEYLPHGSLDDRLREQGPLPLAEALELFREVAVGLVHAHGRGVLHCDLKPANVLLDQDNRPRLADFGQSRLSHEQKPALGTLFYMAPEQADMKAAPDARWDVYALGALLYTMLGGSPPHRHDSTVSELESAAGLDDRLARYRRLITQSPPPSAHRQRKDVDRPLAELIDRCLAINPDDRFPNVQSVLDALDEREARRDRRPLVLLGMIGPALLVLLMGLAAWRGLDTAVEQSDEALTATALENNRFAAELAAVAASGELEKRFRAVEQVAESPSFRRVMVHMLESKPLTEMRDVLNNPQTNPPPGDAEVDAEVLQRREAFRNHPDRQALQRLVEQLGKDRGLPSVASWFFNDPQGLQVAREPLSDTIARNYAWRTYFHGGREDLPHDWRPANGSQHVEATSLSAVFLSQASGRWILGISTPVYDDGRFLGVVALTVEVGGRDFGVSLAESDEQEQLNQFAALVDWRDGPNKGLIIQHPLLETNIRRSERFKTFRLAADALPAGAGATTEKSHYHDPLAAAPGGAKLAGRWLADSAPVPIRDQEAPLRVIVQERHDHAIAPTLNRLKTSLRRIGLVALVAASTLLTALWAFVIRGFSVSNRKQRHQAGSPGQSAVETMATVVYGGEIQDDIRS